MPIQSITTIGNQQVSFGTVEVTQEFGTVEQASLDAATTERDAALSKPTDLQTQITTVLSSTLTDLQTQLTTAQAALTAELATGDGPVAATKRLAVTDIQARIDTITTLQSEATKSDKQKAVEDALAAKAAADKALADAQAALGNP